MSEWPPISSLLPHEPPMRLLDEVIFFEGYRVRCRVTLRDDDLFAQNGRIASYVSVEYMAQTVAAFVALRARLKDDGATASPGVLASCRNLNFYRPYFDVGDVLEIEGVDLLERTTRLGAFDVVITCDGERVAEGRLHVVYQPENEGEIPS